MRTGLAIPVGLSWPTLITSLSGAESEADQRFVEYLAGRLGLECRTGSVNRELSRARSESLEAAARKARYAFLADAAHAVGARYVATAHTANDQAETILHHICRGTGLAGLSGIPRARAWRLRSR